MRGSRGQFNAAVLLVGGLAAAALLLRPYIGTWPALAGLLLLPVLAAAVRLGRRGGIVFTLLATLTLHLVTLGTAWPVARTAWEQEAAWGALYLVCALLASWWAGPTRTLTHGWQQAQEIACAVQTAADLPETLRTLAARVMPFVAADACTIQLVNDAGDDLIDAYTWGLSTPLLAGVPLAVHGNPHLQRVLRGEMLGDVAITALDDFPGWEVLIHDGVHSAALVPLLADEEIIGVLGLYWKRAHRLPIALHEPLRACAEQVALTIRRVQREAAVQVSYLETVRALVRAAESHHPEGVGHAERVTALALEMARTLGLSPRELQAVEFGALLHDIGKVVLAGQALARSGRLAVSEDALAATHPQLGKHLLESIAFLQPSLPIMQSHHERWDGGGYPEGLAGTDIPLLARLVAVANGYEHIRAAGGPEGEGQLAAAMCQEAGTRYDPKMVEVLATVLHRQGCLPEEDSTILAVNPAEKCPASDERGAS